MKNLTLIATFTASCLFGAPIMDKKEEKFGTWPSPIKAELVAKAVKRFGAIVIDKGKIYWEEMRPSEGGRTAIVSEEGDVLPLEFSACTRVHEYGGKSFTVKDGVLYFINDSDQRIYIQKDNVITPLTAEGARFADLCFTPKGLIAVCEVHHKDPTGVDNTLVLIDLKTGKFQTLAFGADFYSSPSLSPDGKKLSWLSWNFPNMPWDGSQAFVADFQEGVLKNAHCVAGCNSESIFEPQWGPDGKLYFISDRTGWWNLYRLNGKQTEALCPKEAEFGLPQWIFGMSTYGFFDGKILCTFFQNGVSSLALIDPESKQMTSLPVEGTNFTQIRAEGNLAAFIKGSSKASNAIIKLEEKDFKETRLSFEEKSEIDPANFSIAQPISYPSAGGRIAHGFYYPPTNKNYKGVKGTLPPLIVKTHGGPTANITGTFSLGIQFWTSRGFAVLDVNYGGSTGYGKAYRDSLNSNWGIVDVEDCEYGAKYLVDKKLADPKKLAITGGSAGGYTTLAALTFGKTFTVGASYYGVSDPALLAKETHKFESHYLDRLIGPYPEKSDLYKARSPLDHVAQIKCPIIFFQGLEDKIVLPNQAELMYDALKKRQILTKLVNYPGEKHGFRKAETIVDSLNQELAFYLDVFYKR